MSKINWEKIKEDYLIHKDGLSLKEFAEKHKVKYSTLRSRKNREKWDSVATDDAPNMKNNKIEYKKEIEKLEDADLTDKQRLFCLYYVKTFNGTQSAIKAGYSKDSAHVEGSRLLRNVKVSTEIRRLKGSMQEEIFIDAMDVLNTYVKIAFADVTDYLDFGKKQTQVMTAFGPLKDDNGNPVMKEVNYVDLKNSSEIDGSILSEVSQGKDGIKVKLLDKMRALEKLEVYFDLFPDKFKREVEEEKLKISREKLEMDRLKNQDEVEEYEDDGFIDALKDEVGEVWDD